MDIGRRSLEGSSRETRCLLDQDEMVEAWSQSQACSAGTVVDSDGLLSIPMGRCRTRGLGLPLAAWSFENVRRTKNR